MDNNQTFMPTEGSGQTDLSSGNSAESQVRNQYMGTMQQFTGDGPAMGGFRPERQGVMPNPNMNQGLQQYSIYPQGISYPQSGSPVNPVEEPSGKSHLLQIIIVIGVFLLISLIVIAIFMNLGPFKQSGGKESVDELLNAYIEAVNKGDSDAIMELIPKCERTSNEEDELKKALGKLEYQNGDMAIVLGSSKNMSEADKKLTEDKLNSLSFLPVRVDSVQVIDATVTADGYEKHVKFNVIESGDRFFIDDVTEK